MLSSRPRFATGLSAPPSGRSDARRALAASTLLGVALTACSSDRPSPTSPEPPGCEGAACDASFPPGVERTFLAVPIDDALARVLPALTDATLRAELAEIVTALRRELADDRAGAARAQLERAYDRIAAAERAATGAAVANLPDLTVVRLSLAPTAIALGVTLR